MGTRVQAQICICAPITAIRYWKTVAVSTQQLDSFASKLDKLTSQIRDRIIIDVAKDVPFILVAFAVCVWDGQAETRLQRLCQSVPIT